MFLEPDPKGRQKNNGSGFFASQRPITSPRDSSITGRRKYLAFNERSPSQLNQQTPAGDDILKPTVRIVKPSPEPSAATYSPQEEDIIFDKENIQSQEHADHFSSSPTDLRQAGVVEPDLRPLTHAPQGFRVSDVHAPTNEPHFGARRAHDNLLSSFRNTSTAEWHRRSGSSGNYSNLSTLHGESLYGLKSLRTDSRTSQGTTLRGTPTPSEIEHSVRLAAEDSSSQLSIQTLQRHEETSPPPSTVRIVSTPPHSVYGENWEPLGSPTPSPIRPRTSPTRQEIAGSLSRRASRRTSSTTSLPTVHHSPPSSPARRRYSEDSAVQSDSILPTSSPNVIAYYSDSSPLRPQHRHIYNATSIESIQARLETTNILRPETGYSIATTKSLGSPPPSADTPPPLFIPKKRLRHKIASSALNAAAAEAASADLDRVMADEDYDTQPYPRQPFTSHLSTIASDSDARSQAASHQTSHFSVGSGVLTGDDASVTRSARSQAQHDPAENEVRSDVSSLQPNTSSEQDRSDAPWPQPLFSPGPPLTQYRPHGPLPPLPPEPRSPDSEENFDTVPELTSPRHLREQRSGYSLRRSQSTPTSRSRSQSRRMSQASEMSRFSQGQTIFPTWAKAYYAYGATLLSSSQISLSTPVDPQRIQNIHQYMYNRDWSERSTVSRLGSDRSDIESVGPVSPVSNRFLPSIWRPRGKNKSVTGRAWRKAARTTPRQSVSPVDSMVITRDPLPRGDSDTLPSGQPKYGDLNDSPDGHRPLPRRYSKQRQWDRMEFPRKMSKDELHDYSNAPTLAPSRRKGQRLTAWRAPSFAESLDTLLRSRCNRQILLFVLGFIFPLFWIIASFLPLPKKPMTAAEYEAARRLASEEDVQVAMMKHEAGDAEQRWREEREWLKARWWRYLNRIMSVVGVLFIAAVIALVVVATRM